MNGLVHWLNEVSPGWWQQMVHGTWQAAVVGAVLLGLVAWKRRWPAPWRYGLLVLALLKFAVPPLLPSPTGIFSRVVAQGHARRAAVVAMPGGVGLSQIEILGQVSTASPGIERGEYSATPGLVGRSLEPANLTHESRPATGAKLQWTSWLLVFHGLGAFALMSWIGWQLWRLRRWVRLGRSVPWGAAQEMVGELARDLGLKRIPELRLSARAHAPLAFGIIRPTILLPGKALERLTQGELRTILAHELAHFRRGDPWVNWLQIVLQTVWWFHPLLWVLNRATRKVREDCCDDLLLARGVASGEAYCETLLRAATEFANPAPVAVSLGFGERLHPLGRRLVRIMDQTLPRFHCLPALGMLVVILLGAVLLPGLRSQPVESAQAPAAAQRQAKWIGLRPSSRTPPAALTASNASAAKNETALNGGRSLSQLFNGLRLELSGQPYWDENGSSQHFGNEDRRQAQLMEQFRQRGGQAVDFLTNELGNLKEPTQLGAVEQRKKAVWLLGQMGPTTVGVIPAITRALEDDNNEVGRMAARTLREMGPSAKAAVPALIEAMRFRNADAGQAVGMIAPESELVARAILEMVTDVGQPQEIRQALIPVLPALKTHGLEIERALLSIYRQESGYLQEVAGNALVQRRPQTAEAEALIGQLRVKQRQEWRQIKFPPEEEVQKWIAVVNSPAYSYEKLSFIYKLWNAGRTEEIQQAAVGLLIERLGHSNYMDRIQAAGMLSNFAPGPQKAVPALMAALDDRVHSVRRNAFFTLCKIGKGAEAAVPIMVERLNSTDPSERFWAAYGLWRVEPARLKEVLPMFLEMAQAEPPVPSTWILAKTFGEIGAPAKPAVPMLRNWLGDENPGVRLQAAQALWQIDGGESSRILPGLVALLGDESFYWGRGGVISLLGKMGSAAKEAVPRLESCLQEEDSDFHGAITNALGRIRSGVVER